MRTVRLALIRMVPTTFSDERVASYQAFVDERARQVEWYWRYFTDWDYQCRGYVMRYDGTVNPPTYARDSIEAWWAENGDDFMPNQWASWGGMPEYCGLATVGGDRFCVNAASSGCDIGTIVHEAGHNYGLRHSGYISETGGVNEYRDFTCIMGGGGKYLKGLNSPKMLQLDLETARERREVIGTTQLLMAPIELPWNALREDEYQHVIVKGRYSRDDVYLSLRKTKGTRFPVPDMLDGKLFAHTRSGAKSKWLKPAIAPGETRELPNGATVTYIEYRDETARVEIRMDDGPADSVTIPDGFPPSIVSAYISPEHNGAWYQPKYDGQGFDLHIHDDHMVGYWYTFDEDNRPIYYLWNCTLDRALQGFKLYRTTGGTWDDPTTYRKEYVGTGKLEFIDADTGYFHFNTDDYGRGVVQIEPVALSQHELNGVWYDPVMDGSGFTVQVFDNGVMAMFWYCFNDHGRQQWYACTGKKQDGVYRLRIREVIGGEWQYFSDVEKPQIGTAVVDALDNTIIFDYDIERQAVGSMTLRRLF